MKAGADGTYTLYRRDEPADWRQFVFRALAEHLRRNGHAVTEVLTRRFTVENRRGLWRRRHAIEIEVRDSLALLQNDATGRFAVLDCHDFADTDDLHLIVRDRRCMRVLKCQYRGEELDEMSEANARKVRPWAYFEHEWPKMQDRLVAARGRARYEDRQGERLYFRGHDWEDRRPILSGLRVMGLINQDCEQKIPYDDYIAELAGQRAMLSLPGMGEICHRDMEAFAVGTCVVRPRIRNGFHDPLVADHHYVSVDVDAEDDSVERVAIALARRWRAVRDDLEYLDHVAANGMRWWDENVRRDACMRRTAEILGLP